jgi:tetratricopeptide (TPR) repeat protein
MARVDSLTDGDKEVLQIGSVIEREFSYELIRQVTGLEEKELISRLSALKDSELLFERGIYPRSTYVFKHALTREVVYESILTKKKRQLHEKIGSVIEQLYKDQIDDYYSVLSEHYIASENYEKGAEYSILAAKKAQKKASFNEAIGHAQKGAVCLEKLPKTENVEKKLIDARVTLELYYNQMIHVVEAKKAVDPIVDLAEKHDYKKRISQISAIEATYTYMIVGNYPKALEYLKNSLKIAEEIGDNVAHWVASHWIGHAYAENCEFENALHHLQKALDINVAANILWGISIMKSCIANTVNNNQGRADLGYELSMEGLRLAEESGDTLSKAEAYTYHGCACYLKGFLNDAEKHLLDGVAYWERIGYLGVSVFGLFFLGETAFDRGVYDKAETYYKKAISLLTHGTMWPSLINLFNVALAKVKIVKGKRDIDLQQLYANAAENKIKLCQGMIARFIGEILVHMGDEYILEAEDWIKKAIDAHRRNNMKWWHLARDFAHYADLLKRTGDLSGVKENIGKAIDIFKKCGADGWVEKYEKEMRYY